MESVSVQLYTQAGKAAKSIEVAGEIFGQKLNRDLVHQVMVAMRANQRISTADVKDRSEVRGGGKKPWRQKGTGRARHGSRRSPIWVGGGVTHGPTSEKDYTQKINKKMKIRALLSALSEKYRAGSILCVDSLDLKGGSAKQAKEALQGLATVSGFETLNTLKNPNNVFVLFAEGDEGARRSLRNLPHVTTEEARNFNLLDVLDHRYVIVVDPAAVSEVLLARFAGNTAGKLSAEATPAK